MEELLPESTIVSKGLSDTARAKIKQARKLLSEATRRHGMEDPEIVTPESSTLVLNLLHRYSGLGLPSNERYKMLSRDAVNGIIGGLRWVYREAGHINNWSVMARDGEKEAHGNPLIGNVIISEFRKVHSKVLAEHGKVVRSAPPLTPEHIIEHGKKFLASHSSSEETQQPLDVDKRDVMLHALLLVQMNCGMRYDESSKVVLSDLKCTKYGITFGIARSTKNSTNYRSYTVRKWPGSAFSECLLMDPLFALASWLVVRGDRPGYLFCNIAGAGIGSSILAHEPWSRKAYVEFMQKRFREIGFGSTLSRSHTGHSAKRGGVQLLRFLGIKDGYIMKWFGMTGEGAYLRYTEGCNDLEGNTVPDFNSIEALQAHAEAHSRLDEILNSEEENEAANWLDLYDGSMDDY